MVQRYLATGSLRAGPPFHPGQPGCGRERGDPPGPGRNRPLLLLQGPVAGGRPTRSSPHFIAHTLPRGLAGLVVAALFYHRHGRAGFQHARRRHRPDRRLRGPLPQRPALAEVTAPPWRGSSPWEPASTPSSFCLFLNTIPEGSRGNIFDLTTRIIAYVIGTLGGMFVVGFPYDSGPAAPPWCWRPSWAWRPGSTCPWEHWFQDHPDIFLYVLEEGEEPTRWEPMPRDARHHRLQ